MSRILLEINPSHTCLCNPSRSHSGTLWGPLNRQQTLGETAILRDCGWLGMVRRGGGNVSYKRLMRNKYFFFSWKQAAAPGCHSGANKMVLCVVMVEQRINPYLIQPWHSLESNTSFTKRGYRLLTASEWREAIRLVVHRSDIPNHLHLEEVFNEIW